MPESPYSRIDADQMILRDELAVERTMLANERTLLAYLRSAVGLLIAGVSIMHFSQATSWFRIFGIACIPAGIIVGLVGTARFWRMHKSISRLRAPATPKTGEDGGSAPAGRDGR